MRETISGNYSWINPVTGQNAMINQSWGNQIQKNEDGQTVYLFSERTNNAAVIFGMEQGPNLSLSKYVQLFRENVVGNMKFSDAGIYDKYLGADRWVAQGTMTDNQNNFVRVQIVQLNDKFWRVVTIQTIPHGTTDLLVEELHSSLWDTVVNF